MVKITGFSCREPGFSSPHPPTLVAHNCLIAPVSGDPAFSLVSEGTSCTWCTLIYRLQGKHPYTQNINKSFLKIMPWFTQDLYFFLLRFCMCFKSDYNRHNTRSATKNQVGHGGKYCNARDRGRKI